jgi:hypothetical protein
LATHRPTSQPRSLDDRIKPVDRTEFETLKHLLGKNTDQVKHLETIVESLRLEIDTLRQKIRS